MTEPQAELEARLLAQAQTAIRAMLAKKKPAEAISLTDIERLVGGLGDDFLQEVTQTLVNDSQRRQQAGLTCPECSGAMRYKGRKAKRVVTVRGEVMIQRAYYYCRRCGRGFFPPG